MNVDVKLLKLDIEEDRIFYDCKFLARVKYSVNGGKYFKLRVDLEENSHRKSNLLLFYNSCIEIMENEGKHMKEIIEFNVIKDIESNVKITDEKNSQDIFYKLLKEFSKNKNKDEILFSFKYEKVKDEYDGYS